MKRLRLELVPLHAHVKIIADPFFTCYPAASRVVSVSCFPGREGQCTFERLSGELSAVTWLVLEAAIVWFGRLQKIHLGADINDYSKSLERKTRVLNHT